MPTDAPAVPAHAVTRPDWAALPSAEGMARYYPEAAQRAGLEGSATISCAVAQSGSLQACRLVAESPPGAGFGAAALQMAPLFHMRPMSVDGHPVAGGAISIPIRFRLPKEPDPPASEVAATWIAILLALAGLGYLASRWLRRWAPGFALTRSPWDDLLATRFAERFEAKGDRYVFRANLRAPGVLVTAAERDHLVADYVRRIVWLRWSGVLGVAVVAVPLFLLLGDKASAPWAIAAMFAPMLAVVVLLHAWLWRAPERALQGRSPSERPRSPSEARRLARSRITWRQLGTAALMVPVMLLNAARHDDLMHGWARAWLAVAAILAVLIAAAALRKWRQDSAARDA